jgi:hypothetical protein
MMTVTTNANNLNANETGIATTTTLYPVTSGDYLKDERQDEFEAYKPLYFSTSIQSRIRI